MKIRKRRLIREAGSITTPQHSRVGGCRGRAGTRGSNRQHGGVVGWLWDTYLASSTTSTSAWAVMGAFECAVSGSSAFSSPLVKLTTCTKDRLHVLKTRSAGERKKKKKAGESFSDLKTKPEPPVKKIPSTVWSGSHLSGSVKHKMTKITTRRELRLLPLHVAILTPKPGGRRHKVGLRLSVFLVHTISTWEAVDDLQKLVSYRRNACCKQEQTHVTCESVYTTGVWRSPKRWEHAFSWPHQAVPPRKRLCVLVSNLPVTSWRQNTRT